MFKGNVFINYCCCVCGPTTEFNNLRLLFMLHFFCYSCSIIQHMEKTDMWTLGCKATECDAECTETSSRLKIQIVVVSICHNIHKTCRLILIAEKLKVYQQFPIPLINRMEKHFVYSENVLTPEQKQISSQLSDWVEKFSKG